MNKKDIIGYLKDYVADPKLLTLDELTGSEKQILPDSWLEILSHDPEKMPSAALTYWKDFDVEFEQVVEYLEKNLVSVDLIHHGFGYCMLYGVVQASDRTRILYYEGRNPKSKTISPMVLSVWDRLPEKLRSFYEFNNGWYYLASGSMGLSPVEDFFILDEEEWGILEELDECPVNLKETLALYTNGMGRYVCIEFEEHRQNSLLWSSNGPPKLDLDFWAVVDSWTVMGFE